MPESEGRTIPLNSVLLQAIQDYRACYVDRFGQTQPERYVFAFGKPRPCDPTRPMVTLKTSWNNMRVKAGVKGRWHDNRHTLITDLAESGVGDETIRDLAGHVSRQMLKHYSHIRMPAKRDPLEGIVAKGKASPTPPPVVATRSAKVIPITLRKNVKPASVAQRQFRTENTELVVSKLTDHIVAHWPTTLGFTDVVQRGDNINTCTGEKKSERDLGSSAMRRRSTP